MVRSANRPERHRAPSLETLLDREVEELDRLLSEIRRGIANQAQFDLLEGRATAIAKRIRAAFRGKQG